MKTAPKQPLLLNQLLFPLGCSVNILSARTGISARRLEEMFAQADATELELGQVAQALEQPLATAQRVFSFNQQRGDFNQNGTNQRQKVNAHNRRNTVKIKNLNVIIQVISPEAKPAADDPNARIALPRHWGDDHLLVDNQSLQLGRSLTSGTYGI